MSLERGQELEESNWRRSERKAKEEGVCTHSGPRPISDGITTRDAEGLRSGDRPAWLGRPLEARPWRLPHALLPDPYPRLHVACG